MTIVEPTRRGTTVIELLVVVGVIGLLVGLLLPAVQAAREAARRAECANRQGQLIRATLNFESVNGGFPPSIFLGKPLELFPGTNTGTPANGGYSAQCCILPFLEQNDLYNSINFRLPAMYMLNIECFHRTAVSKRVEVFLCPSDAWTPRGLAPNSYRACQGSTSPKYSFHHPELRNAVGVFEPSGSDGRPRASSMAKFRDGASNTLAFSEKPIGSGPSGSYLPFRDWFHARYVLPMTPDEWVDACGSVPAEDTRLDAGASWMAPGAAYTAFNTAAPPNSRIPDCGPFWVMDAEGLFSARSFHPGGVNAAMADGSVRWFSSSTAMELWRGLGTRDGGELVDN